MRAPQIIFLALTLSGLLIVANKHGQKRDDYNFWTYLLATALELGLLWWGGFFN